MSDGNDFRAKHNDILACASEIGRVSKNLDYTYSEFYKDVEKTLSEGMYGDVHEHFMYWFKAFKDDTKDPLKEILEAYSKHLKNLTSPAYERTEQINKKYSSNFK